MMFKAMAIILLLISIDVHAAMVVDVTDGDTLKVVGRKRDDNHSPIRGRQP